MMFFQTCLLVWILSKLYALVIQQNSQTRVRLAKRDVLFWLVEMVLLTVCLIGAGAFSKILGIPWPQFSQ